MTHRRLAAVIVLAGGLAASPGGLQGQWARIYGRSSDDTAHAVLAAPDGCRVLSGSSFFRGAAGASDASVWVVKVAPDGRVLWQHVWECADLSEGYNRAGAVLGAPGGGVLLAASLKPKGRLESEALLAMVAPDGGLLWEKRYGGAGLGGVPLSFKVRGACPARSGGFLVVGSVGSESGQGTDLWAARFDWEGRPLWQRRYGGPANEDGFGVREESDGTFYLAGQTASFGSGMNDVWVLNVTGQGDVLWQKAFGGPRNDIARSLDVFPDGGLIVAGDTLSFGPGDMETLVVRIDRAGGLVWQRASGGKGEDWTGDVRVDAAGRATIVGSHIGRAKDLVLLELSAEGGVDRRRTFGEAIGIFELSNEAGLALDLVAGGCVVAAVSDLYGAVRDDVLVLEASAAWSGAACRFLKTVAADLIATTAVSIDTMAASSATSAALVPGSVLLSATTPWTTRPICPSKKSRPRR